MSAFFLQQPEICLIPEPDKSSKGIHGTFQEKLESYPRI
jgi:hypothetical protein